MALRIESSTLNIIPTVDPNVVWVEADVTKDDATVKSPQIEHVRVLWNTTTDKSVLKDNIRAAMKENSLRDNLRKSMCETVFPQTEDTKQDMIIQANSVTIQATNITIQNTGGKV